MIGFTMEEMMSGKVAGGNVEPVSVATPPVTDEEREDLNVLLKSWAETLPITIRHSLQERHAARLIDKLFTAGYRKPPPLPTTAEEQELLGDCNALFQEYHENMDEWGMRTTRVATALKARIERGAVVGEQWQPISTCPDDASLVLVYQPVSGIRLRQADGKHWSQFRLSNSPTYWHPLPSPPQTPEI